MNPNICNNCGDSYEYRNGRWVCRSCGSYKPEVISGEEMTLLYAAFQKLRLAEFDEAEQAFDDILQRYPKNPNGYWGRLMARYGIKYEKDFDGRMIPTCYATSMESVVHDADYQKALQYADAENKAYYEKQAGYMERVRVTWVEKAKKEKPYDIFICYKDSDLANGIERTQDSFAAQEIYTHLLEQGYRVFFSRESLREKTGEKYEPYIFNALSTAKIMLVYGSSAEYIKSTWLKNEWHRFSKKISVGEKHPEALLVACEGFSPGELPHVLSSRQCFDATRRTFFGDLDQCIARIMAESGKAGKQAKAAEKAVEPKKAISALHEHSYQKTVVKATCVAKGYTLHRCECGEEYRDSYTPLLDHRFSKWTETKHPTCTENGEEQRKCLHCGEVEKRTLEKTGHSFGDWVKNPNGTSTGYCKNCGATKTKAAKPELSTEQVRTERKEGWIIFVVCLLLVAVPLVWLIHNARANETYRFEKLPDGTYSVSIVGPVPASGNLEIPSQHKGVPVTALGDGFIGKVASIVTSVVIPDSVTVIGEEAFCNCDGLTVIVIPDGVTTIGDKAFYDCDGLTEVVIPNGVSTVGTGAFAYCDRLTGVTLGSGVTEIGQNAFRSCPLESIVIPEGVTSIGDWAFDGCESLTSVVIPESMTTIGYEAFSSCNHLQYIYFTGSESDWKEIVDSTGTPIVDSVFSPFPSEAEVIFDFS